MSAGPIHKYTRDPVRDARLDRVMALCGDSTVAGALDAACAFYVIHKGRAPRVYRKRTKAPALPAPHPSTPPAPYHDGARLLLARRAAELSTRALAALLTTEEEAVSHQLVGRWERGEAPLSDAAVAWLGAVGA